jgi:UrcA family protein
MTKTFFARTSLIIAAALVGGSALPAQASSGDNFSPTQAKVSLTGVDMTSDAGILLLRHQVRRAAIRVCAPDAQTTAELQHGKACMKTATAKGYAMIETLHQKALATRGPVQTLAAIDRR